MNQRCKLGIFPKKITLESSFGSMLYARPLRHAVPSGRQRMTQNFFRFSRETSRLGDVRASRDASASICLDRFKRVH